MIISRLQMINDDFLKFLSDDLKDSVEGCLSTVVLFPVSRLAAVEKVHDFFGLQKKEIVCLKKACSGCSVNADALQNVLQKIYNAEFEQAMAALGKTLQQDKPYPVYDTVNRHILIGSVEVVIKIHRINWENHIHRICPSFVVPGSVKAADEVIQAILELMESLLYGKPDHPETETEYQIRRLKRRLSMKFKKISSLLDAAGEHLVSLLPVWERLSEGRYRLSHPDLNRWFPVLVFFPK